MRSLGLKVCGMKYPENINDIVKIQPDYIGFIFYNDSPRYMGITLDNVFLKNFPGTIKKVGVFVNEELEKVRNTVLEFELDLIQLHGDESPEYCLQLRKDGHRIIKVISVGSVEHLEKTIQYKDVVDYFLFDTHGKYYGGNGLKFDWDILKNYSLQIPYFLSGGIRLEDISDVIKIKDPRLCAIDINSGFEISPGLKDSDRIKKATRILKKESIHE